MSRDMKESINKGVPIEADIVLSHSDLINIFEDKNRYYEIFNREFQKYLKFLIGEGKPNLGLSFFRSLAVVTNEESSEKNIVFSYGALFQSLIFLLNIDNINNMDFERADQVSLFDVLDETLLKKFVERIEVLSRITNDKKFKREFPYLYKHYVDFKNHYGQYKTLADQFARLQKTNPLQYFALRKQYVDSLAQHNQSAKELDEVLMNASIDDAFKYTRAAAKTFSDILNKTPEIDEYTRSHPINLDKLSQEDQQRFELYLAYKFLVTSNLYENETEKQKFLYYVCSYFYDNQDLLDSDLAITVGEVPEGIDVLKVKDTSGIIITPKILHDMYRTALVNNPALRVVDFNKLDFSNMSAKEAEDFLSEYIKDLNACWEFLKGSEEEEFDQALKVTSSRKPKDETKKEVTELQLLKLFMAKKEFFGSTRPLVRIKGKTTFDGYIGYIYPSGKVLLDKFYRNSKTKSLAYGEGLYVVDLNQLYEASKLRKELILRNNLGKRIIHKGNWQDKARREINQGIDENIQVELMELRNKL